VELILVESIEACNGLRIIAMLWESTREANYLFGFAADERKGCALPADAKKWGGYASTGRRSRLS
jgi:hypothetical protein